MRVRVFLQCPETAFALLVGALSALKAQRVNSKKKSPPQAAGGLS